MLQVQPVLAVAVMAKAMIMATKITIIAWARTQMAVALEAMMATRTALADNAGASVTAAAACAMWYSTSAA